MKMEDNVSPNELVEEPNEQETHVEQNGNTNKIMSDERNLNKTNSQKNTKSQSIPVKKSQTNKKTKKNRFSPIKTKRINMYLVLNIYCILLLTSLLVCHYIFEEKVQNLFNSEQGYAFLLFIIFLVVSLIFSAFASYCECLINTHLFGILFFIILNICVNYCILYLSSINERKYFEQFFCALIILVSGSLGLLIITIVVKDEVPALFILFIFSGLFAFVGGLIICAIYNNIWNIVFSVVAFIISEFNIYSSQYKYGNKQRKKQPMVYSQPFELIISIFKLFYFVLYLIIISIKACCKVCKKEKGKDKEEKEDSDENINQQNQDNVIIKENGGNQDEAERGGEGEEGGREVGEEHNGSKLEMNQQSQE